MKQRASFNHLVDVFLLACVFFVLLFTAGCAPSHSPQPRDEADFLGEIIQISENPHQTTEGKILVENHDEPEEGFDLVWLFVDGDTVIMDYRVEPPQSGNFRDLAIGQKVNVWTDDIFLFTYPPQGGAIHIHILED